MSFLLKVHLHLGGVVMMSKTTCKWAHDKNRNNWKAGCDFGPSIGDLLIYHFIYCPNCGRRIDIDGEERWWLAQEVKNNE